MARDPWWWYPVMGVAFLVAVVAILAAIVVPLKAFVLEPGCDQRAGEQSAVRSGDYRLLSDTCYLTLDDGTVIPADQYRTFREEDERE